ncbi:hypothetical protein [Sphingomonas bacterium]|uniref:hypothetical protein n=1 Tax=Sphingomonas bacterium TaxID=1895847 RepID=UPI001575A2DC|nr:hypothetical protein [Sphingomonas bacterium]
MRLQWRPEAQGPVVDALDRYLSPETPRLPTGRIALTRDSVCMADDADAPHDGTLVVDEAADLTGIAEALLASNYLAMSGRTRHGGWRRETPRWRSAFAIGCRSRGRCPVPRRARTHATSRTCTSIMPRRPMPTRSSPAGMAEASGSGRVPVELRPGGAD